MTFNFPYGKDFIFWQKFKYIGETQARVLIIKFMRKICH